MVKRELPGQRVWLVHARMRLNLKQEEVADAVGVSRPYYCQIENGVRNPSPPKAKKIALVLRTNWTYFYEEPEKIPPYPRTDGSNRT